MGWVLINACDRCDCGKGLFVASNLVLQVETSSGQQLSFFYERPLHSPLGRAAPKHDSSHFLLREHTALPGAPGLARGGAWGLQTQRNQGRTADIPLVGGRQIQLG